MTQAKTPSRNYARDYVVHAFGQGAQCANPRQRDRVASWKRSDVTCKRCLAALAKAGK
jgi:Zn ribbon nucleic-acid-binding protein